MQTTWFYRIYFKFAYIFLCAPFYVSTITLKPKSTPSFILVACRPQKFLGILFTFLTSYWIYHGSVNSTFKSASTISDSKNPTLIFHTIWRIFNTFLLLLQLKLLWWDSDKFVNILNWLSTRLSAEIFPFPIFKWGNLEISTRVVAAIVCVLHTIISITDAFFGNSFRGEILTQAGPMDMQCNIENNFSLNFNNFSYWDITHLILLNLGWLHRYNSLHRL